MVEVEGQDLAAHARLKNVTINHSILPTSKGGGRMLNESDIGKPHVVISTKIAGDYPNADGSPKRVGQTIRLGSQDFPIVGLYNTGSPLIDSTIVMDIGMARKLLNLGPNAVSTYNLEPVASAESDILTERIEQAVPGVRVQRISQFNLAVGAIMGRLNLFLLLAVALAALVGGVGIANTMLMSTSERYVEFGVMRTVGWTRRNVLALVTAESRAPGPALRVARRGASDGRRAHAQPIPRRILARTEPLADGREPRGLARARDDLGPLPRVEGVADDPDGRDPTQRDLRGHRGCRRSPSLSSPDGNGHTGIAPCTHPFRRTCSDDRGDRRP